MTGDDATVAALVLAADSLDELIQFLEDSGAPMEDVKRVADIQESLLEMAEGTTDAGEAE